MVARFKYIAYQESDAREVEVWYVADPATPGGPPYPARYPRPGKANVRVRLGVVPVTGGQTVWTEWDHERYPYLASVHWDENGPLTLAVQTRDQKELLLLKADPSSGQCVALITERDAAWITIRQDVPRWLANDKGFLWASERPGQAWQLEWRRPAGTIERIVVPSGAGFRNLVDLDPKTGEAAFVARPNPTEWKLYRASVEGENWWS